MRKVLLSAVAIATLTTGLSAIELKDVFTNTIKSGYVEAGTKSNMQNSSNSGYVELGQIVDISSPGIGGANFVGVQTKLDNKNIDVALNKMFNHQTSYGFGKIWKKDGNDGFYGTIGRAENIPFGAIGTVSANLGDGVKSVKFEAVKKVVDKQFAKVSVERDFQDYVTSVKIGYGTSF